MGRRISSCAKVLSGVAVACALYGSSGAALAASKDAEALELSKQAIEVDYLGTQFKQAADKLKQAVALCKADACSAPVRARVFRDYGVVLIAGLKQTNEGKKQFAEAVKADPSVTLDPDLTTPEVQKAYDEARKAAGLGPAPAAPAKPAKAEAEPPAKAAPVAEAPEKPEPATASDEGDLGHEPSEEQAILTPVPVFVDVPQGLRATRLTLSYRPFGSKAWKTMEMSRVKKGWGAEIPCLDVGSATGTMSYFVEAKNEAGEVVGFSGTRGSPHRVPIKNELDGEPPHLPGKPPPAQCQDSADCPPGFPGCHSGDAMADSGGAGGDEEGAQAPRSKNWLSLGVQQDFLMFSAATGVCDGGSEYQCFFENPDKYYDTEPYSAPESGNEIEGGFNRATTRVLVGYDRAFTPNIALGARLGYAFGGGPQAEGGNAFLPFHAEARATYYFGSNPLSKKGLRGFAHLSGGMAEVDGKVLVTVYVDEPAYRANDQKKVNAWRKTGLGFAALGGGVMYAVAPTSGLYLDVRVMQMFGVAGTAFGPQVGYAQGF